MQVNLSFWQLRAAKIAPWSFKRGKFAGDGQYMLISRCGKNWRVLLFSTAEARDRKFEQWRDRDCGTCPCFGNGHEKIDLHF